MGKPRDGYARLDDTTLCVGDVCIIKPYYHDKMFFELAVIKQYSLFGPNSPYVVETKCGMYCAQEEDLIFVGEL